MSDAHEPTNGHPHPPHDANAPEASAATSAEAAVERDNTRTTFIFLFVVGTCIVLGGMVVVVDQFFGMQIQDEIARKLLQPENSQLRKLRADEESKLTSYRWVDQAGGVVQIPVDRAVELTLAEWKDRPSGHVPGTAAQQPQQQQPAPGSSALPATGTGATAAPAGAASPKPGTK